MTETGRSSVRINGRPATAAYVREIGEAIAEIVGQHEAQRLLIAGVPPRVARSVRRHRAALKRAARWRAPMPRLQRRRKRSPRSRRTSAARASATTTPVLRCARSTRRGCEPGEEVRLDERRRYLDNVERIASALQTARRGAGGRRGRCARSARRGGRGARVRRTIRFRRCAKWRCAARRCRPMLTISPCGIARALGTDGVRSGRARCDQRAARAVRSVKAQARLRRRRARRARATAARGRSTSTRVAIAQSRSSAREPRRRSARSTTPRRC